MASIDNRDKTVQALRTAFLFVTLRMKNKDGTTPALKAAERNDFDILKALIKAGTKVDVSDIASTPH